MGFPIVLKGLGAKLTHKTERGLVHLRLKDAAEVRRAAALISAAGGADLEGYLLQPMLSGRREFVAGFSRDPQFGPVVMFGLGGIFTEALDDVAFRVAPLNENHAEQMIDELRAKKLLGPFRGEAAVLREGILRSLMGLSRLSMELADVARWTSTLSLSPRMGGLLRLCLDHPGDRPQAKAMPPPVDPTAIGKLFYPRSIAFVGASATIGKWGYRLFCNVVAGGFKVPIYWSTPKAERLPAGRHSRRWRKSRVRWILPWLPSRQRRFSH